MSLSEKSDEEIAQLLAQYDIKHGPIVGKKKLIINKRDRYTMCTYTASISMFLYTLFPFIAAIVWLFQSITRVQ